MDGHSSNAKPLMSNSDHDYASIKYALKAIFSACHGLDLGRCFKASRMQEKAEQFFASLSGHHDELIIRRLKSLFKKALMRQILTGAKVTSRVIDADDSGFVTVLLNLYISQQLPLAHVEEKSST